MTSILQQLYSLVHPYSTERTGKSSNPQGALPRKLDAFLVSHFLTVESFGGKRPEDATWSVVVGKLMESASSRPDPYLAII